MQQRYALRVILAALIVLVPPASAYATDGHFLHAVGAVQSAMGGAGIAAPKDLLGTFYLNPAGLTAFEGSRIDMGFEMFKADRSVSSSFGPLSGETVSKSEFTPIPAFGWATRLANDRVVVGLAGMGIGGFGVDYRGSDMLPPGYPANPILAPRPGGFGQIYSNFQLMKISPAIAFEVNDRLSIGVAANIDWASLSIDPMPAAAPAVDPGPDGIPYTADDRAYYSRATAADGVFGYGFQAGLLYRINDIVSIGAAYTSKQDFQDFEYNAVWENPYITSGEQACGTPRLIKFAMDMPAVVGGGLALNPLPTLTLAGDVRYIMYEGTDGFALTDPSQPFNPDGSVAGFGWENILVLAFGGEFQATDRLALRFGYNHSDNPVPDDLSMINMPAPAVVTDHLTLGFGLAVSRQSAINVGYYHAFVNEGSGPILSAFGPVPGSNITNRMSEDSLLMQFSFVTRGGVLK